MNIVLQIILLLLAMVVFAVASSIVYYYYTKAKLSKLDVVSLQSFIMNSDPDGTAIMIAEQVLAEKVDREAGRCL